MYLKTKDALILTNIKTIFLSPASPCIYHFLQRLKLKYCFLTLLTQSHKRLQTPDGKGSTFYSTPFRSIHSSISDVWRLTEHVLFYDEWFYTHHAFYNLLPTSLHIITVTLCNGCNTMANWRYDQSSLQSAVQKFEWNNKKPSWLWAYSNYSPALHRTTLQLQCGRLVYKAW